jgi:hypothetical protein
MEDKYELLEDRVTELEQEVEEKTSTIGILEKGKSQYRNWWLNEIRFTRVLLNRDPGTPPTCPDVAVFSRSP